MKALIITLAAFASLSLISVAQARVSAMTEELDPFASNIEEQLDAMDAIYSEGYSQDTLKGGVAGILGMGLCYQRSCPVFLDIDKKTQTAALFINGSLAGEWKISSGAKGRATPNFDRNPNGRVYTKYSSSKFPGGDYNGLGNMPYAVFISGGFAVHGTPKNNWSKLGTPASHGCIRMHPDNAKIFNQAVRQYGVKNSWITVR